MKKDGSESCLHLVYCYLWLSLILLVGGLAHKYHCHIWDLFVLFVVRIFEYC